MGNSASTQFRKQLSEGNDAECCKLLAKHGMGITGEKGPLTSLGNRCNDDTVLHAAADKAMPDLLATLLRHAGDAAVSTTNPPRNQLGESVIHRCCVKKSRLSARQHCLSQLLAVSPAGAVKMTDQSGNTPLHFAAAAGAIELCLLLLQAGAHLEAANVQHYTPCDVADLNGEGFVADTLECRLLFGEREATLSQRMEVEDMQHGLTAAATHRGMRRVDLQEEKDSLLIRVSASTGVESLFVAEALLRAYDWDEAKLQQEYFEHPEEALEKANVSDHHIGRQGSNSSLESGGGGGGGGGGSGGSGGSGGGGDSGEQLTCNICFCDYETFETLPQPCGHVYCRDCMSTYADIKLKEGELYSIVCPTEGCSSLIPRVALEEILSPAMRRRYAEFDISNWVDSSPTIKWCTAAGCDRAVVANAFGPMGSTSEPRTVFCGKTHFFCWGCGLQAHEPLSCEGLQQWLTAVQKYGSKTVGMAAKAAAANADREWLTNNTRPCPQCKAPIEKNGGCMHMTCKKPSCGCDFCWACGDPWRVHNSGTGGYFKCNRGEEKKKVESQLAARTKEAEALQSEANAEMRLLEVLDEYRAHDHILNSKEARQLDNVDSRTEALQLATRLSLGAPECALVRTAFTELVHTRMILRNAGPYAYTMKLDKANPDDAVAAQIFADMLKSLEATCARLADAVGGERFRVRRSRVVALVREASQRRGELLSAVENGLVPPSLLAGTRLENGALVSTGVTAATDKIASAASAAAGAPSNFLSWMQSIMEGGGSTGGGGEEGASRGYPGSASAASSADRPPPPPPPPPPPSRTAAADAAEARQRQDTLRPRQSGNLGQSGRGEEGMQDRQENPLFGGGGVVGGEAGGAGGPADDGLSQVRAQQEEDLVQMGFSRASVSNAMDISGGNTELALDILTSS